MMGEAPKRSVVTCQPDIGRTKSPVQTRGARNISQLDGMYQWPKRDYIPFELRFRRRCDWDNKVVSVQHIQGFHNPNNIPYRVIHPYGKLGIGTRTFVQHDTVQDLPYICQIFIRDHGWKRFTVYIYRFHSYKDGPELCIVDPTQDDDDNWIICGTG